MLIIFAINLIKLRSFDRPHNYILPPTEVVLQYMGFTGRMISDTSSVLEKEVVLDSDTVFKE